MSHVLIFIMNFRLCLLNCYNVIEYMKHDNLYGGSFIHHMVTNLPNNMYNDNW